MRLPYALVDRLTCPVCGAPLAAPQPELLRCEIGHAFAVKGGVPILRHGVGLEDVVPRGGEGVVDVRETLGMGGLKKAVRDLLGTNYVPHPFPYLDHFAPDAALLNIGAGMTGRLTPGSVNLDCFLFPTVDVVADAAAIPFADETFNAVVSEFTIEHVADPFAVCREMARVLKPGGRLYVSYPFIHPYHSFPLDYFRFTTTGLQQMLPGLVPLAQGPLTGPACRWIGATADFATFWIRRGSLRFALRALLLGLLFPVKFLDVYLNTLPEAMDHAVTLFGLFEKPRPNG